MVVTVVGGAEEEAVMRQFISFSQLTIIATRVISQYVFFVPTLRVDFDVKCAALANPVA